ncbi:helix-turn-helix domain-containing protein [Streptomyces sp. NPDC057717]|uniref:helix-turn-helix domain-containing protein n=1 Tax=Streptomyces sp. NPDC057717 TaxID=3346224 RepID=UPI0036AA9A5B
MTKTVAYHWHLRKVMNEHSMQATTELLPLLADRGVVMTSTQVYRIVTGEPERLNMRLLAALCDIFDCTPNDLIEPYVASSSWRGRKTGTAGSSTTPLPTGAKNRPTRAVITPAEN